MERNLQQLPIGYKIRDHYKIIDVLGQGGFGIVYLVKDLYGLNDIVVIKELFARNFSFRRTNSTYVYNKKDSENTFQRIKEDIKEEINILEKIDNENIVKAYGCFEENNTIYSIMEYIDGEDLEKSMERATFSEHEAKELLKQLINGLKEIHSVNIIHRDIKPNNIIKTRKGIYKIIDFTTYRSYKDGAITTVTGFKNPIYSPPELIQHKSEVGAFSDIYSIGMTLISLLVKDKNSLPNLTDRLIDDSEFQRVVNKLNISSKFRDSLIKMTQVKFKNRFQNLQEIEEFVFQQPRPNSQPQPKPTYELLVTELPVSNIYTPKAKVKPKKVKKYSKISTSSPKKLFFKKILMTILVLAIAYTSYIYIYQEFNRKNIREFLENFVELEESNNVQKIMPYFASKVDYFGSINMKKEDVYKSRKAYCNSWFERDFRLLDFTIVDKYSRGFNQYCKLRRKYRWRAVSDRETQSGIAVEGMIIKKAWNGFQIVSITNIRNKRDKLKKVVVVTPPPVKESKVYSNIPSTKCKKMSYLGRFFSDKALEECRQSDTILGKAFVARAIYQLGDEDKAKEQFKKLTYSLIEKCNQNSSDECNLLGYYFQNQEENIKSFNYYQKACSLDSGFGCSWLGYLYDTGKGVSKDDKKALSLYEKGCSLNNDFGCSSAGVMYHHAKGTEQDYKKAISLYKKGCDLKSNLGCSNLGYMYKNGQGVDKDYKEAVKFYRKGCSLGSNFGCYDLAYMYQIGRGVKKDKSEAKRYYKRSCNWGYDKACKKFNKMKSK